MRGPSMMAPICGNEDCTPRYIIAKILKEPFLCWLFGSVAVYTVLMGKLLVQSSRRSACFSLAAALLLASRSMRNSFALQASRPASITRNTASTVNERQSQSSSSCKMSETTYSFGNQRGDRVSSFLAPLIHDWILQTQKRRRGILSPSIIMSSKRGFSFLEESNLDEEENLLKYLPMGGVDLAPMTRELLNRVTSQYVTGREPAVEFDDVLDVIGAEYKSHDVPVVVGDETFDFSSSAEVDDADVARILSFAAYHRLPRDVALLLFGPDSGSERDEVVARCREAFAQGGWKDVHFPNGLSIRPKRKFVKSSTERYMPMPRAWMSKRKDAARRAKAAVDEAMYVTAPARRLLSREEFLAAVEELSTTEPKERLPSLFRDARLFFPRQNRRLKGLKRVLKKQSLLLKHAGFAGLISYVALNFTWYTFVIVSQWHHASTTVDISSRVLRSSLKRFGKALAAAYIGSQLTRLLRIKLALALAPFGNRALRLTQKKLRISETKAFALLAGVLFGSCIGLWSIIVLGDAAIQRTFLMIQ